MLRYEYVKSLFAFASAGERGLEESMGLSSLAADVRTGALRSVMIPVPSFRIAIRSFDGTCMSPHILYLTLPLAIISAMTWTVYRTSLTCTPLRGEGSGEHAR